MRIALADAAIKTAEAAVALTGGAAFLRDLPIERLWRDIQGARFHPLSETKQVRHAGRQALGLPLEL